MADITLTKQYNTDLTFSFPEKDGEGLLRELILYISDKCLDDPNFGAIKLNKILYFADFLSYEMYGEPITGIEYMKLRNGPAPKRMLPIREDMRAEGDIIIKKRPIGNYEQHRVVALKGADLDKFKARDIALVDEIIQALWGRTANEVSELSHNITWKVATEKSSIPYQAALLSDEGLTTDDITRAWELINQ